MSIIEILQPWTENGDERFRAAIAKLAYSSRTADAFDFISAEVRADPALFAYFARPTGPEHATLSQLTVGAVPSSARPAEVLVVAGVDEVAHLPGLGYAKVEHWDDFERRRGWAPLEGMEPEALLSGSVQAITRDLPAVVDCLQSASRRPNRSVAVTWARYNEELRSAWATISDLQPELGTLLSTVLRHVILFRDDHCNSFADATYFGGAFCNMALGRGAVFLVEDLVHQGGHNVLMAAASSTSTWFETDPNHHVVDAAGEHSRNLYVLWHGTITEALMVEILHRWLSEQPRCDDIAHELMGRYAFVLKRFTTDISTLLRYEGLMTPLGKSLLDSVYTSWAEHVRENGAWVGLIDLSDQDYNFSYDRYCSRYPAGRFSPSLGSYR